MAERLLRIAQLVPRFQHAIPELPDDELQERPRSHPQEMSKIEGDIEHYLRTMDKVLSTLEEQDLLS